MKVVQGDLVKLALDGRFEVIIHGCNCQCEMGAGIAKVIKQTFPEAYKADQGTAKGSRAKLGTFSSATVERDGNKITVVNGYTQFHWRGAGIWWITRPSGRRCSGSRPCSRPARSPTRNLARAWPRATGASSLLSSRKSWLARITRLWTMRSNRRSCDPA